MFDCKVIIAVTCLLAMATSQQKQPEDNKEFQKNVEFLYNTFTGLRKAYSRFDYKARSMKCQPSIPIATPFPCNVTHSRSPVRPSSVHRLRPGDIDVVGALGDSITAAYGATTLGLLSVIVAERGVSYAMGGAETWRTRLTLPNMLRLYNPNLVGFSRGTSPSWGKESQFNVAEGFATSAEMAYQARLMVQRMKADKKVNFEQDWKMVTVLIGNNDLCSWICYGDAEEIVNRHRLEMIEMLDYLKENVPRIFVNIIAPPNLLDAIFTKFRLPNECYWVNRLECSCLLDLQFQDKWNFYNKITEKWMNIDKEITELPQYQDKEDFAVVFQPFTMNVVLPAGNTTGPELPMQDASLFAPDCFHFSQKLHALAANALWNNMFQPVGSKSDTWRPNNLLEEMICPSEEVPFFYTAKNSDIKK